MSIALPIEDAEAVHGEGFGSLGSAVSSSGESPEARGVMTAEESGDAPVGQGLCPCRPGEDSVASDGPCDAGAETDICASVVPVGQGLCPCRSAWDAAASESPCDAQCAAYEAMPAATAHGPASAQPAGSNDDKANVEDRVKSVTRKPLPYRAVKRTFDVVFSLCVIAVGIVPGLILSVFVAVDTKGTPIYTQERVGRGGRPFSIYKFRTMVADSDDVEKYLDEAQLEQWRRERKVEDDPRVTPLGRALRCLSVDELPQFVNVLLGQISVVGPRVITYDELEQFGDRKNELISVPPGITGLWQTGPRNEATFESGRRQLVELNYVQEASVSLDVRIFFRTFAAIVKRTGK